MKKLKKIMGILLVFVMMFAVLTSCGETKDSNNNDDVSNEQSGDIHTHTAGEEWLADKDGHWHVCVDDEEKIDAAEHNLVNGICGECGVEVVEKDQLVDVYFFNEYENWIRCLHYDADGKVTEDVAEYAYDEDGNIETVKVSTDGTLVTEGEYAVDSEGYNYESKSTQYEADGTKLVVEYNNFGDIIREAKFKADGSAEYDLATEHKYDEAGKKVSETTYDGDKIVKEVKYILVTQDSWGGGIYNTEVTTYNDDGTTTVQIFNENGNLIEG